MQDVITTTQLNGIKKYKQGKVRDVYVVGENLLIVATDRISAFDCILPSGIPNKGKVLTKISEFWFNFSKNIVKNHLITCDVNKFPQELKTYKDILSGRAMLVKKSVPLKIECVVRGYLAGSGWKEYKEKGEVCGIKLPKGLKESSRLPEPIFTPSTKADTGHDINIREKEAQDIVGNIYGDVKKISLEIYERAAEYARERGIIICDTKFEFGSDNGQILLIDEILTPDSSRFWPSDGYVEGKSQQSFDKQFVRDYLETLDWNKQPPAPKLPEDIINKTSLKYIEAYTRITGRQWQD